jgi:hypothetical protein
VGVLETLVGGAVVGGTVDNEGVTGAENRFRGAGILGGEDDAGVAGGEAKIVERFEGNGFKDDALDAGDGVVIERVRRADDDVSEDEDTASGSLFNGSGTGADLGVGAIGTDEFELIGNAIVVSGDVEVDFHGDEGRLNALARGVGGEAVVEAAGEGIGGGGEFTADGLLGAAEFAIASEPGTASGGAFVGAWTGPAIGGNDGAGAEEEDKNTAVDAILLISAGVVAGAVELGNVGLGKDHGRVELAATLEVGLPVGISALAEKAGLVDFLGEEEMEVFFEEFGASLGASGAVGVQAVGLLELANGIGGLGSRRSGSVAGIEAEGLENDLEVFEAPVVTARGIGVDLLPAGDIVGDDGVDGFSAAAAENLVEFIVADGIGVAVYGEWGVGVGIADEAEVLEFGLRFGTDERAPEVEADVVESPAGDGVEFLANDVLFALGAGGGVDG